MSKELFTLEQFKEAIDRARASKNEILWEYDIEVFEYYYQNQLNYKKVYTDLIKFIDDYEEEMRKVYDEHFFETGDYYMRGVEEGQLIAIRQVRRYIEEKLRKEPTNEEGKPSNNGTL